jgi:predicted Fe-Mo cluster-binding NifX family protein
MSSRISDHFGGSPFYVVVDTETAGIEVVSGKGCRGGGSSGHHVGQLSAHGVQAVACRGMGRRAFAAMRAAGFEVFRTERGTVAEVIEAVRDGQLSRLTEDQACGGGRHHRDRHHHSRNDAPKQQRGRDRRNRLSLGTEPGL